MPTLLAPPAVPIDLDARIEAFERAWDGDNSPSLNDFLPSADDPDYAQVLAELVRVELEFLWKRRTPRPVEIYLARFPILQSDPELLGGIAFEEYRQRLQAGESVSPDEYRSRFGLNVSGWQKFDALAEDSDADLARTNGVCIEQQRVEKTDVPEKAQIRHADESVTQLPEVGDIVQRRFRIKEKLGKGAFGSVFLAERLDLFNRPVALKFLPNPSVEPAMLAQLIHENIVPIESVDRYGSLLIICMPFRGRATLQHVVDSLPRESLGGLSTGRLFLSTLQERSGAKSSHSRSGGSRSHSDPNGSSATRRGLKDAQIDPQFYSLSQLTKLAGMSHIEACLRITVGVVSGLIHAHEHNIVHRDLKPANILLSDDGTPMILDFNLATQIRRVMPLDCMRLGGTFPYMAPEQIQSARDKQECRDPRGDLYSMGVVLYELLTGKLPFPKTKRVADNFLDLMLESRQKAPADPCQINPAIPRSVADIINKLLSFDAANRYQSARELKEDLERELSDRPLAHARESSLRNRFAKFRRRRPRLTTGLLVGAAATLFLLLPAGIITTVKVQSARRLRETQLAEAMVLRDKSQRIGLDAQTFVQSKNRDSRLFRMSLERADELARNYAIVPGTAWDERPEVSRLQDGEKRDLENMLGETFQVVSLAADQWAKDTNDSAIRLRSEEFQKLAQCCFEKSGRNPTPSSKLELMVQAPKAQPEFAKLSDSELFDLASALINKDQYRRAALALEHLTQRSPRHFMAWFNKATCYDNLGNDLKAEHAWRTCVVLDPDSAICHHNLGLSLNRLGKYEAAEQAFSEVCRLDPEMRRALLDRGLSRMHDPQKLEAAEADFTSCLEDESTATNALWLRSKVRWQMGKPFGALIDHAEAMKREPNNEWGYSVRAFARLDSDPNGALADLDQSLKINPRYQQALRNKIHVLGEKLDRTSDALATCDLFLSYYPDVLEVHAIRGIYLARLGHVAAASREADLCLNTFTPTAQMYFDISRLYSQLSRSEEGADHSFRDKAVQLLEHGVAVGFNQPQRLAVEKDLEPIKGFAGFKKVQELAVTLAAIRHNSL
jgi:serine/threonine protein kinase